MGGLFNHVIYVCFIYIVSCYEKIIILQLKDTRSIKDVVYCRNTNLNEVNKILISFKSVLIELELREIIKSANFPNTTSGKVARARFQRTFKFKGQKGDARVHTGCGTAILVIKRQKFVKCKVRTSIVYSSQITSTKKCNVNFFLSFFFLSLMKVWVVYSV